MRDREGERGGSSAKEKERKQNRVTNIEICVSTADEEDMDMARWQTSNRHRLINAWKMQQLPELDNSRHFPGLDGERVGKGKTSEWRDALLVNKSFERIFTHNLSSFHWTGLTWLSSARSCRTAAAQEICQCTVRSAAGNASRGRGRNLRNLRNPRNQGNLFACSVQ